MTVLDAASVLIYEYAQWREKFDAALANGDELRVRRYTQQGFGLANRMRACMGTDDITRALVETHGELTALLEDR